MRTIVIRESEWDDESRWEMEDLVAHENEIHSSGCGLHPSVAETDPDLRVEPYTCPSCAGFDLALRIQSERDDESDKARYGTEKIPADRPRASDGRKYRVRELTPKQKAAEAASTGQTPSAPRKRTRTPRSRSTG